MSARSVKGLLGQPIISLDTGKRVGTIQELLYDTADHRVCGVVLSRAPGASSARVVTIEHIALFGQDVTLIDSEQAISEMNIAAQQPRQRLAASLIRTQVITTDGRRLGEVADIELDQRGLATGYQLAQNVVTDTLRGRLRVPVQHVRAIGPDAILVEPASPSPHSNGAELDAENATPEQSEPPK